MAYSQPTYAGGKGTADAPRLGATSDNISGYDQTTAAVVNAVKQQAAKEGLTAWGYSFLKQLGEAIKPEWLKESSREWFNKPLPDPLVPPKDDFLKIVEPAVLKNTANNPQGIVTQAIRDKGGFGGLWEKYHKEVGDLDQRYAELPAYLDPKRISDKAALYDSDGRALPGTPQTPSLRAQAEADAQKLAADQASYRATNSYQTIDEDNPPAGMTRAQARQRNRELNAKAEADFRAGHLGADDVLAGRTLPAATTPPGSPVTPFVPTGQTPAGTAPAPVTTAAPDTTAKNFSDSQYVAPRAGSENLLLQAQPGASTDGAVTGPLGQGTQNFLPPYLQSGGAGGSVNDILNRYKPLAPGSTTLPPLNTGALAPEAVTPAGSPMAPFVPQGVGQVPGQPVVTGAPRMGTGGFASTAKLLELPYYLRNLGAPTKRRTGVAS